MVAFFTFAEATDVVIMSLVIGFIFKDLFPRRPKVEVLMPDDLLNYRKKYNWSDFWFAVAIVAPSILLHEMGHKFVALASGMTATFHASYVGLLIGVILKVISFGFIFFVPAYVQISGGGSALQMSGVAFAGPAVNLVLWLSTWLVMKKTKKLKGDLYHFLFLTSRINMFMFIFNMLPIPGFDGWSVYSYLFKAIF
jgi:Zn-dependent protease